MSNHEVTWVYLPVAVPVVKSYYVRVYTPLPCEAHTTHVSYVQVGLALLDHVKYVPSELGGGEGGRRRALHH